MARIMGVNLKGSTKLFLFVCGVILAVLCWFIIPVPTLPRVMIYLFLALYVVLAPVYLAEKIISKYPNISELNASIISVVILLAFPTLLNVTYLAKYDLVMNSVPVNNMININVELNRNMISNNSVGNDWFFDIDVDGERYKYNEKIKTTTVNYNGTLKIKAKVTESDNIPDIGRGSLDIELSKVDFTRNSAFSIPIKIRENRGRYSGNIAEWELIFNVKRNMSFWEIVLG